MSKIKEIWCLPHSHLDVGYTHPQNMLLELQSDYIDEAIDLCMKTADWPEESRFRWTCEATYPVVRWLKTAEQSRIELFRKLVKEGRISIAALPMHTTPGCTAQQLTQSLQHLDEIRELTGSKITTAINHDVNGQPWTMADLLLDSRVEFYLTGINMHMGGIPFSRPYAFLWKSQDGRTIPSFVGEHYSLFSQFLFTYLGSTEKMHEGVQEYVNRIEQSGWNEDFVYLTATNPPLFDNNSPDQNLPELVRKYNEEGHEQIIRFVTPEMLYERVKRMGQLDVHAGDWTDYWNFGCASTAREVKINRAAKVLLQKNDFLTFANEETGARHYGLTEEAYENTILFDEHTWGSTDSVNEPDQDDTYAQLNHKKEFAYTAADLSAYLVSRQVEKFAKNPLQSDSQDGILVVNPTGVPLESKLEVPEYMLEKGRTLADARAREFLPYEKNKKAVCDFGTKTIAPFSAEWLPFASLSEPGEKKYEVTETGIRTPYYEVEFQKENGRIRQIKDRRTNRKLLKADGEWGLFDLVEENIDERFAAAHRDSIYPENLELRNRNISVWQHDWRAVRSGITEFKGFHIEEKAEEVTISYYSESKSLKNMEQKITFSGAHPRIQFEVTFVKDPIEKPEGIYFTFPLQLENGWDCIYDTADRFVKLDEEQLGTMCRDYITVDKSVSMFDGNGGVTLACPDTPMVQIGGFHFGKECKEIERQENPLLLAWPMNNYWCTNFAASQEGKHTFRYELTAFDRFDEKEAYQRGLQAQKAWILGAAIQCEQEKSVQLLSCDSEDAILLFIRPQYQKKGWLAAVKNFADYETTCKISIPDKKIASAAITDIQGNLKEQLQVNDQSVELTQKAKSITFLNLCLCDESYIK